MLVVELTHPRAALSVPAGVNFWQVRSLASALAVWCIALLVASTPALAALDQADDRPGTSGSLVREWAVHAGIFDVGTNDNVGEVGVEARFRLFDLPLGGFDLPVEPAAGAMVTGDEGAYAHLSFRIPLHEIWSDGWPERWRVVPFTGVGVYEEGDGKDLGGPVEFRSGIEVSYRVGRRWWLGAALYHLSNAVLYDENPGEESLVAMLSWR